MNEMSEPHINSSCKRRSEEREKFKNTDGCDERPMCRYGEKCYRKNPQHFKEYNHPDIGLIGAPKAKRQKLENPLNLDNAKKVPFKVSTVNGIPSEYNCESIAIGIKDILSTEHGELKASAQFNYMFDIPWLIQQYPLGFRTKPLLIVHGDTGDSKASLEADGASYENIDFFQAKLSIAYGTHHTKMMFLLYEDGLRIVIHTANIISQDWDQKTQGIWMSPKFMKIEFPDEKQEQPMDRFKEDLLEYLEAYGPNVKLDKWRSHIKEHDMTVAKVRIIASVPGRHTGSSKYKWGHLRLRNLLTQIGPDLSSVDTSWPVIGQFSSIGSLGPDERKWLCSEWLESLSAGRRKSALSKTHIATLKLIFPTIENVRTSLEGYKAGGSLPYSDNNAKRQLYLHDYFHQWKSSTLGRTRASPHIKTYSRLSPDSTKAAWFLVTSANLSKAAWGVLEKKETQLMIRSYEIGVIMTPQLITSESTSFRIAGRNEETEDDEIVHYLQLPYDVPLTPYGPTDSPWIWDRNYTKVDSLSGTWMPRR